MVNTQKQWPETVSEAVDRLLAHMSEKAREDLKNAVEDDLLSFHFGLGLYVRNNFGLWAGNDKLLESCGGGVYPLVHPDDVSAKIIKAAWERVRGDTKQAGA